MQGLINSCTFDLCGLEGDSEMQSQFRCTAYQNIATWCSGFLQNTVLWRSATKCRKFINIKLNLSFNV